MARAKQIPRRATGKGPRTKNATKPGRVKKPYSYRPSRFLLQQIRLYKKRSVPLGRLPKIAFRRHVKDIAGSVDLDLRFQSAAIGALQEATELYLVSLFKDAHRCASYAGRSTVTPRDMKLVRRIRGQTL